MGLLFFFRNFVETIIIEIMIVYENYSYPLEDVDIDDLVDGKIYVTEDGVRVKFDEKNYDFIVIQASELNMGEYLSGLTPKQLKLYWTLMKNKSKKV